MDPEVESHTLRVFSSLFVIITAAGFIFHALLTTHKEGFITHTNAFKPVWWSLFALVQAVQFFLSVRHGFNPKEAEANRPSTCRKILILINVLVVCCGLVGFLCGAIVREFYAIWACFLFVGACFQVLVTTKSRGTKHSKWGSFFVAVGILIYLLVLCMSAVESARVANDMVFRYPPPGKLVNGIHIRCKRNNWSQSSPAVVFIGGGSVPGWAWQETADIVANFTTACTYDRAGYGWSYNGDHNPRTNNAIADELYRTLKQAGIPPPYILVPHSIAGQYTWAFTRKYRKEVAGLVLCDAQSMYQLDQNCPATSVPFLVQLQRALDVVGVTRMAAASSLSLAVRSRGAAYVNQFVSLLSQGRLSEAVYQENSASQESCRQTLQNWDLKSFANLPITVISSGVNINSTCQNYGFEPDSPGCQGLLEVKKAIAPMMALQGAVQARHLSKNGTWVMCSDCDHDMWSDAPGLVAEQLSRMIAGIIGGEGFTPSQQVELRCREGRGGPEAWCQSALCDWCSDAEACRARVEAGDSSYPYCTDLNQKIYPSEKCVGAGFYSSGKPQCTDVKTCSEVSCLQNFFPVNTANGGVCPQNATCI